MTRTPNANASSAAARAVELTRDDHDRLSRTSPVADHPVSGRYRGRREGVEVELRVDVDGARPTNSVSADYFHLQDDKTVYVGSMRVDEPTVSSSSSLMTITGAGRSTWEAAASNVDVTIPRAPSDMPRARATLRHVAGNGQVQAVFECDYESESFRTALLEEDTEQGVNRFSSYDTGSLPAGCQARTITIPSAFANAGIEVLRTRRPGMVETADVAANASWSDAELHAAMVKHFSLFADAPQWAIWLLHARLHDRDRGSSRPKLFGLMFDQRGRQRQGCALFYQGIRGTSAQRRRLQLFTCIHELGHGFNLLHSFQKSLATPPVASRPGSATWMAYPDLFPGGAAAFWQQFAFRFDEPEIAHLRHAFRQDVIMGGNPFTAGAAFEQDAGPDVVQQEDPGLRMRVTAPPALPYGVPVTVDFELRGTTREGRRAPTVLGPRPNTAVIQIRRPDGTTLVFEPFIRHCRVDDVRVLRAGDPPVRDSAFIHYGKDGFIFDRPGRYEVRARCVTPDGSLVLSDVARIDVHPPVTRADHAAAELVFGDEQGILMSLVGSDAPELRRGNEALRALVERYPNHPVAAVPRLVHATNAAREFKAVQSDGSVAVRKARPQEAAALLHGAPGLEAMLRASAACDDDAALPQMIEQLLPRVPTNTAAAYVLHPFIRSRVNEIAAVIPRVLASMQPAAAPTGSDRQRRAQGYRRTRSP
jgi:hypothetical protein